MNTEKITTDTKGIKNSFALTSVQNSSTELRDSATGFRNNFNIKKFLSDYAFIVIATVGVLFAIGYKAQSIYQERANSSSPMTDFVFK